MSFIGQLGFWPDPLVAGCIEIVGPNDLLGVWPLWGPQLVTNNSVLSSPLDLSASPPWSFVRCSVTTGHADPDGGNNAGALIDDGTPAANHYLTQSWTLGSSSVGPATMWFRARAGALSYTAVSDGISAGGVLNLSTGAVTDTGGCVMGPAQNLGGGWWLCPFTANGGIRTGYQHIIMAATGPNYADRIYNGVLGRTTIYLYNPTLDQTSIVTAPNLYGVQTLAKYGDRFDLTNPTKASQPVLMPDDWDGLECARFSGANYLYADAVAVQLSGIAAPTALVVACSTDAINAVARNVVGLGHSINGVPYAVWRRTGASIEYIQRNDAGTTVIATYGSTLTAAQRTILAARKAAALHGYKNAVADAANPMAASAGQSTFDRFTVGAVRNVSVPAGTGFWQGTARCLIAAKSDPSDAAMQAASRLVQAYCPV